MTKASKKTLSMCDELNIIVQPVDNSKDLTKKDVKLLDKFHFPGKCPFMYIHAIKGEDHKKKMAHIIAVAPKLSKPVRVITITELQRKHAATNGYDIWRGLVHYTYPKVTRLQEDRALVLG